VTAQPIRAAEQRSARGRLLGGGLQQLVRRGLRGVWLRGALPDGGFVWAANHHSWWDGFVAGAVLHELGRPAALLMDGANLGQFQFLESVGVLPATRPREALAALQAGRALVIFPEGDLRPAGGLGPVARGAAWLADHAQMPLTPVAVRVAVRGHQYGEAYLDVGCDARAASLAAALGDRLVGLDLDLATSDPRLPLPGFTRIVPGRQSWDERITRWSKLGHR
jgi:Acyltransferase